MAIQQDLTAWQDDEEIPISKYAEGLPFIENGVTISPDPKSWKCEKSGDAENLWLNLSDGFIGGGRKNVSTLILLPRGDVYFFLEQKVSFLLQSVGWQWRIQRSIGPFPGNWGKIPFGCEIGN